MKIVVVIASPFMSCATMFTFIDSSEVASMLAGDLLNFHDRVRELGGAGTNSKKGPMPQHRPPRHQTKVKQRGESEPGGTLGAACGGCCGFA